MLQFLQCELCNTSVGSYFVTSVNQITIVQLSKVAWTCLMSYTGWRNKPKLSNHRCQTFPLVHNPHRVGLHRWAKFGWNWCSCFDCYSMQAIATGVTHSIVCPSVSVPNLTASHAKTAEPIDIPFQGRRNRGLYMEVWAPPGEYSWTIRARRRCGLSLRLRCERVLCGAVSRCACSTAWRWNDASTARSASTFRTSTPTATCVSASASSRCSSKSTRIFRSRSMSMSMTINYF